MQKSRGISSSLKAVVAFSLLFGAWVFLYDADETIAEPHATKGKSHKIGFRKYILP